MLRPGFTSRRIAATSPTVGRAAARRPAAPAPPRAGAARPATPTLSVARPTPLPRTPVGLGRRAPPARRRRVLLVPPPSAAPAAADVLLPLGLDFLTFLAATVLVVPVFKSAKVSPVLGFLFSGLVLGQLG